MNFDEITLKMKKLGKDTLVEVQKLNDIRVLRGKISASKKQINSLYAEIGKRIYEQYKEEALAGFEAEITSINENLELIEDLKQQIREVKGVVVCPCCGTDVAATEAFCPSCGNKMPDIELPEDEEEFEEDAAEEAAEAVEDAAEEAAEAVEDAVEIVEEVVEETAKEPEE